MEKGLKKFKTSEKLDKLTGFLDNNVFFGFFTNHVSLAFFYGIFLFLYENAILREVVPAFHPLLIAWACALAFYDIFIRRLWKEIPFYPVILLFFVSALITAVLNFETGIVSNAKAFVMTAIPFLSFYPVCVRGEKKSKELNFIKAMSGASLVVFLSSLIALYTFILRISKNFFFKDTLIWMGIRNYIPGDPNSGVLLYGLNKDTNHSALYTLVFAAFSVFLFIKCKENIFKRKWVNTLFKVYAVVSFIVNLCYFPLANSRGGWIALIIALLFSLFTYAYFSKLKDVKVIKKFSKALVVSVIVVLVFSLAIIGVRNGLSKISTGVHAALLNSGFYTEEDAGLLPEGEIGNLTDTESDIPEEDVFLKNDELGGSGRLSIWQDVLRLYVKQPIMGDGPGNNQYYSEKFGVAPYTMGFGKAVHNSYLDLLLNYGAVGFVIMMAFWVLCAVKAIKSIVKNGKELSFTYYLVIMMLIMPAVTSLFLSSVFINTTAVSFIMFVTAGYLAAFIKEDKVKAKKEK